MEREDRSRYIDRYKLMSGKEHDKSDYQYIVAPDEYVNDALKIISVNPSYMMAIKLTESSDVFYNACRDLKKLIPEEYREDIFYSIRLEKRFKGIPSKLISLLTKAKAMHDLPNVALSMIPEKDLSIYTAEGILPEGVTLTDVVSNVWGTDVKIMSPYRKRAEYINCVEVYVEHKIEDGVKSLFDTVVILPKDISDTINDNEVASIIYYPEVGLKLNDVVLRCIGNRIGITKSDIDLRGAF